MTHWTRRRFLGAATAATAATAVASSGSARAQSRPSRSGYERAAAYSAERRGVSLVVMQDHEVHFEDYPGGNAAAGWELASGTKSFTGLMAAAAQADDLLDIDAPCADVLPEWAEDARRDISIRHLLTLTSGLNEVGEMTRPPEYAAAVKARVEHPAGERFQYGPTPFQAFGEILRRRLEAAGERADPVLWFKARVLDGIDVRYNDWKRGRDGNPFLPQGAHFTGENWARFGQWVLDGADGVDQKVVASLFEPTTANPGYGLSWWLLRPGLIGPNPRAGLDAESIGAAGIEEDIVMAAGAGDQRLYLFRERQLVVVRQANQIVRGMFQARRTNTLWNDAEFIRLLLS